MRTDDQTVSVQAWETYYYIKDRNTGDLWSRNRWGSSTSIPDLYATKKAVDRQCNTGKVSLSGSHRRPVVCSCIFGYESATITATPSP